MKPADKIIAMAATRTALRAFCAGLSTLALPPVAAWSQALPDKPVRWVVPFAEGEASEHVSRWPVRGNDAQPRGFIRVAAREPAPYPVKPVKIVVPFAPGGGVDVTARTIAHSLSTRLGQQFVIDNRGGANGNIGVELAVKSPPDGYTILTATTGNIVINPHIYSKLPFDPVRDLTPVTPAVDVINVLVVHPALPVKSVKELIALAKARPNQLNFGSGGAGGSDHIAAELFKSMSGAQMVNVSYKGGAPAMIDLVAGNVELMFATMAVAIGPIKSGRLRPLGLTSSKRFELLPELPTIAEAGLAGYEAAFWFGVFAPAGTPREIVARLNSEIRAVLQLPEIRQRLLEFGLVATGAPADEFAKFVQTESGKWAKLAKDRGLRVE